MTQEQLDSMELGIPETPRYKIIIESAFTWIENNTTLQVNLDDVPANVKLFVIKFVEIMSQSPGVSSEKIEGMSQSFESNRNDLIWQIAKDLLGNDVVSDASVYRAVTIWE